MDDGKLATARAAFDKAIAARAERPIRTTAAASARCNWAMPRQPCPTLSAWSRRNQTTTFRRAGGMLAHAYAQTGQKEKAEALFRQVTITSTLSETYLNFADLLASEGRTPKPANGPRRCWTRGPPCRAICAAASAPGSAPPPSCSAACPPDGFACEDAPLPPRQHHHHHKNRNRHQRQPRVEHQPSCIRQLHAAQQWRPRPSFHSHLFLVHHFPGHLAGRPGNGCAAPAPAPA